MTKQKETKVPYKIREQDETPPEKDEHGCAPDEEWDGEKCVPKKQPEATEQATPAPNVGVQSEGEPEKLACPEGFHLVTDDQGNQKCEPDLPPPPIDKPPAAVETEGDIEPVARPAEGTGDTVTVADQTPCPEGQHRDPNTGLCVVDTTVVTPAPNIQTETVTLPRLLKLGEPFAGYTNMDDCIAKNPDKEDPAAYCATIMRKVEGEQTSEIKESHNIYETQQAITKSLKEIRDVAIVRDAKIAETANSLNRALAATHKNLTSIYDTVNQIAAHNLSTTTKHVKAVESAANFNILNEKKKLTAIIDSNAKNFSVQTKELQNQLKITQESLIKTFNNALQETGKQTNKYITEQLTKLATAIAEATQKLKQIDPQTASKFEAVNKRLDEVANQLTEHTTTLSANSKRIDEVANLATEQKTDFEKILAEAVKNSSALKEHVKSLEEWKAEKEKQVKETAAKQEEANQTAKAIKEAFEPLQTEIENLKASLKGITKQKHPDALPKPEELDTDNLPYEND